MSDLSGKTTRLLIWYGQGWQKQVREAQATLAYASPALAKLKDELRRRLGTEGAYAALDGPAMTVEKAFA